jgi:hypothetical protein
MSDAPQIEPKEKHPLLRQALFLLGIVLIIVSPLVGAIPGPGGVIVFAAGLGLVLKYSGWAKRQYVKFKRKHPNKGRWADWGMRRPSARRREAIRREADAAAAAALEAGMVLPPEVAREPERQAGGRN